MTIHEHLKSLNACEEAQIWASTRLTGQQCWDECERIDWIFWWTAVTGQTEGVVKTAKEIADSVAYLREPTNSDRVAVFATYAAIAANTAVAGEEVANAISAANHAAAAIRAANAPTDQRLLNIKIAKENLVCPFVG